MNEVTREHIRQSLRELLNDRPALLETLERLSPAEFDAGISRMLDYLQAEVRNRHSNREEDHLHLSTNRSAHADWIEFQLPESLDTPPVPKRAHPGPDRSQQSAAQALRHQDVPQVRKTAGSRSMPSVEPDDRSPADGEHVDLEENDLLYLFGVRQRTDQLPQRANPFSLDIPGLQDQTPVMGLDVGKFRAYLCKLSRESINVSGAGVLLLSKEQSLHLRGNHERTINDLRSQGVFLPFEFGHAFQGSAALEETLEMQSEALEEALDQLLATLEWKVEVSVVDAKILQLLGPESSARRRERLGTTSGRGRQTQERIDVKTLERILHRERRLADLILADLQKIVERCDVESIIGIAGESSKGWKQILAVRAHVPEEARRVFFEGIAELQATHQVYQPLIRATGAVQHFSLRS